MLACGTLSGANRRIFVVIPNFREPALVKAACDGLRAQGYRHFLALFVNCDPGDDTSTYLAGVHDDRIREVPGDPSWFWGRAVRAGQEIALQQGMETDCLMTMNVDVALPADALEELLGAHLAAGGAMVAAACRSGGRLVDSGSRWRFQPLASTVALHRGPVRSGLPRSAPADLLTGRATLYSIRMLVSLGLVDDSRFPHYACDSEYSWRARGAGWQCAVVCPPLVETGVRHSRQAAPPKFGIRDLFSRRSGISLRTRTRYLVRTFPMWMWPSALLATWARCLLMALLRFPKPSA